MEFINSNSSSNIHFVLVPFLAQGHIIPMIDIARLLASRGITVSFITTPANLSRIKPTVDRVSESNLPVNFIPLAFPSTEFGLPDGCENLDSIPSPSSRVNFVSAAKSLKLPLTLYLRDPKTIPPPSCIISDSGHSWTLDVARELGVPRIVFHGFSCFSLLCIENLTRYKTHETVTSDSDTLVLPGLAQRIEMTRPQLPKQFHNLTQFQEMRKEMREADLESDGIVVNSFEELETGYSGLLEKSSGKKVWMIGPVSMCSKGNEGFVHRGNKSCIGESKCSSWLDSRCPNSVVYVCFGSMGAFPPSQFMELGSGLLASNHYFIWAIKSVPSEELGNWLDENFDESRCLVIRGWAPQLMILSHPAVGGFMTHCGWNSSLEGICAGLPLATWPLFADQFLNEKLLVEVLRIGVSVGVKKPSDYAGKLKDEVAVGREDVARVVEKLMDAGEVGEERRQRARGFKEPAKKAMVESGSSYLNLTMLIDFVFNRFKDGVRKVNG
ncbi:UDP-glycosyltransferase 73D1-like [Iris pallida]|uniref:Glycosyltransferase n=1 Tax=Iris pallida TaxID=29817 RepID=A0AAX6GU23_IRIPA|nr:UDP-glycosyltransferase 73D1-like [Iris pallida]